LTQSPHFSIVFKSTAIQHKIMPLDAATVAMIVPIALAVLFLEPVNR
jgi:hypothetical protein